MAPEQSGKNAGSPTTGDVPDVGRRKLLKRGKLVLPAVVTLQVSYSAWASAAELARDPQDPFGANGRKPGRRLW